MCEEIHELQIEIVKEDEIREREWSEVGCHFLFELEEKKPINLVKKLTHPFQV